MVVKLGRCPAADHYPWPGQMIEPDEDPKPQSVILPVDRPHTRDGVAAPHRFDIILIHTE